MATGITNNSSNTASAQPMQEEVGHHQDAQIITVFHGTTSQVLPGGLIVPKWCGDHSSIGLWLSEEFEDALEYAKKDGDVHAMMLTVRPDQVWSFSSWGNAKRRIEFLGGGGDARAACLAQGISAMKIDRNTTMPVEWIVLDPALLTPLSIMRVRGSQVQTVWSRSPEILPTDVSRSKPLTP